MRSQPRDELRHSWRGLAFVIDPDGTLRLTASTGAGAGRVLSVPPEPPALAMLSGLLYEAATWPTVYGDRPAVAALVWREYPARAGVHLVNDVSDWLRARIAPKIAP